MYQQHLRVRRRPTSRLTAVVASLALGLGLLGTLPAQAAPSPTIMAIENTAVGQTASDKTAAPTALPIADAVFTWGLNRESGSGAFFGGCNFLSAGKAGNTGSSRLWTQSDGFYQAANGNVSVRKATADGWATPTWATKCQDGTVAPAVAVTTGNNRSTGNQVQITNGTGTVDPAANTAALSWDGDFSVVFYGGLTYWSASDPTLTVAADGTGTVTATASGYGADMNDPGLWNTLDPVQITLATLTGVEVTEDGVQVTPDYLGVAVSNSTVSQPAQSAGNAGFWGSFPQSFVDFQVQTGQAAYWYTSGGARDAAKPAAPLNVSYTVPDPVLEVTGAQLEWAYSQYAQYGVFGPWSQKATGDGVSLTRRNGKAVSGSEGDASTTFTLARFDGGTGMVNPDTGEGTISWSDTGDWVLNAYNGQYGAPDETLRDPILTIDENANGTLSFEVFIPAGLDMNGNPAPAAGPSRIDVATIAGVSVTDGVITVTPEFAGRTYPATGTNLVLACSGAGGSWPSAWIGFLPESVRSHYYTTSCTGLNTKKPPLPFTVDLAADAQTITTQPASVSIDGGEVATFSVIAAGNPIGYQWQQSADQGQSWTDIGGAIDFRTAVTTVAADNGARYRVVVTGSGEPVVSDAATLTLDLKAPVVDGQPSDRFLSVGDTEATLYSYASGKPQEMRVQYQTSPDKVSWTDLGDPQPHGEPLVLPTLTAAMDGLYWRAVFDNGVGVTESATARLYTLPRPPVFSLQPLPAGAFGGQFAQFAVRAAAAVTPITYQWQSSADGGASWQNFVTDGQTGHLISSGRVLQVMGTADNNGHLFRATATSADGTSTSDAVSLTVFPLTGNRVVHVLPAGKIDPAVTTTLSVFGEGFTDTDPNDTTGNLTIAVTDSSSWQVGQDGTTGGAVVSTGYSRAALTGNQPLGLFNTTLVVPAGALEAGKSYGVATFAATAGARIWDSWTAIERKPEVVEPTFVTQPVSQSIALGGSYRFAATTAGTAPSYHWEKAAPGSDTWAVVPGQVTAAITGRPVAVSSSGTRFRLVATNAAGSVTSEPVTLTVGKATAVLTATLPTSTVHGQALSATVRVAGPSGVAVGGTLVLKVGTSVIGQGTVVGGQATIALKSTMQPGSKAVVIQYGGDANLKPASLGKTLVVTKAKSAAGVTLTATTITTSTKGEVKVKVTAAGAAPTGKVSIRAGVNGRVTVATVTLTAADKGIATVTLRTLGKGAHRVSAVYAGSSLVSGATSPVAMLTVK